MAWDEQFSELLDFKQDWGHCDVPQRYANNTNIGKWVYGRRWQCRLLKSSEQSVISNERIVQFEKDGLQWISNSWFNCNTAWDDQFS